MDQYVANFLVCPGDRATFNTEIKEIEDDVLWDVFTYYQPTLGLESRPIFGNA
jgi:hypothetical protein